MRSAALYCDLLKRTLTNWPYAYAELRVSLDAESNKLIASPRPADPGARAEGRDLPPTAHTMIGMARLSELEHCIGQILVDGVPGDFLEAGVWRGGAAIFMRGMLEVHGIQDRDVYLADSFRGFPEPDYDRYPREQFIEQFRAVELAVPRAEVERNFSLYGLMDEHVKFIEGYFEHSLRSLPFERLALLRIDADLYASTTQVLEALYPRLSVGGYVIVDDYGYHEACRSAVADFRERHGVSEPITHVDWTSARWRRER